MKYELSVEEHLALLAVDEVDGLDLVTSRLLAGGVDAVTSRTAGEVVECGESSRSRSLASHGGKPGFSTSRRSENLL